MILLTEMSWAGHVALIGGKINVYGVMTANPDGNRLLGKPRCRWEDSLNMDLHRNGLLVESRDGSTETFSAVEQLHEK
jgi:hypothetical protein